MNKFMEDKTMANETLNTQGQPLTREVAMARFMAAKRKKKEAVDRMTKELIRLYEAEHGEKPKYIEVW